MSYKAKIADMRAELRVMNKLIPDAMKGFAELSKAAKDNAFADHKTMEMVALGMALVQRCEPCINFHIEALIKAGGTREELGAVLAMAIQMGGGPAVMYTGHALGAWDELTATA